MISLEGLSLRQIAFLNEIWVLETMEEALEFMANLPLADQQECQSLIHLVALELLDQSVDELPDYREASVILDKFRLT